MPHEPSQNAYATIRGGGSPPIVVLAPTGAGLSAFSGHSCEREIRTASYVGLELRVEHNDQVYRTEVHTERVAFYRRVEELRAMLEAKDGRSRKSEGVMAKKRPKEQPISTTPPDADVLAALMEYLRLANKEARADRKALRAAKELAQHAKEAKVALDNAMIDQMMAEAKERADRAMEAATTGLVMGIVSGNVSASGGAWTITVPDEKGIAKKSDLIRLQIRHQEDEVEKAAKHLAEADEAADASRKHKQAIRDAILKLLEIMAGIKPQV